ncbi:hypothetical protein FBR04_09650, partial [Betaproteobacteria bacterium PRO7]|nr:hypothetical protein [Betaproteobacteria bacterium PRO7]
MPAEGCKAPRSRRPGARPCRRSCAVPPRRAGRSSRLRTAPRRRPALAGRRGPAPARPACRFRPQRARARVCLRRPPARCSS